MNSGKQENIENILYLIEQSEISSIKSIVSGIVNIISDPESTLNDLKKVIQVDPPLTSKVLKVANSAFFSPPRKIGEIKQALIWIGFEALKELALSQKVCRLFNSSDCVEGYSRRLLWKHSVAVALIGKMIYRREFRRNGAGAYAAGLLHDIGLIVEDQFLQSEFREVLRRAADEQEDLARIEQEVFGLNHAEIGMALTASWDLPQEMCVAIGHHNSPQEVDRRFFRLASTLYVSEYLCRQHDLGYSDTTNQDPEVFERCLESLRIEACALELIVEDVKQELSRIEEQGFF